MPYAVPLLYPKIDKIDAPTIQSLQRVIEIWQELCAPGERMPRKKQWQPSRFVPFLSRMWLAEKLDDDFRMRLHGTQAVADTGRDLTGEHFSQLPEPLRVKWLPFLTECLTAGSPVCGRSNLLKPTKEYLQIEVMAAPLSDEDGIGRFVIVYYDTVKPLQLQPDIHLNLETSRQT